MSAVSGMEEVCAENCCYSAYSARTQRVMQRVQVFWTQYWELGSHLSSIPRLPLDVRKMMFSHLKSCVVSECGVPREGNYDYTEVHKGLLLTSNNTGCSMTERGFPVSNMVVEMRLTE